MITAAVLVGEGVQGRGPLAWVQAARRAAATDLLRSLADHPKIERVVVASPEPDGLLEVAGASQAYLPTQPGPIHIGRCLADITARYNVRRLLYFGGASAPLLSEETLSDLVDRLNKSDEGLFVNNQFASDWAGIAPATALTRWQDRLPLDNMLGWVLSTEAGLPVQTWPATAESRLDIDTPVDLLTLRLHPGTKHYLRDLLVKLPLDTGPLEAALAVLKTPAKHVLISGRIGPVAWQALNQVSRCWLRVIAEERGMVSSGRQAAGEVFSILAGYMDQLGPTKFFEVLAGQCQAAFIDSRVLMAHHRLWPSAEERFASDLGLLPEIQSDWLREFSAAALDAPIPVVLGGHGLLAGDLLALCDLI